MSKLDTQKWLVMSYWTRGTSWLLSSPVVHREPFFYSKDVTSGVGSGVPSWLMPVYQHGAAVTMDTGLVYRIPDIGANGGHLPKVQVG